MMPTAEEFFKGISEHKDYLSIAKAFAKMHVTEALKQASKYAEIEVLCQHGYGIIDKDSILNSYPLENIK